MGFDIDPQSLETATLNAEELEVFFFFEVLLHVNESSFGCCSDETVAIIWLVSRRWR